MKLKYVLLSLLIGLIILMGIDIYVEKGVLNKKYMLEELIKTRRNDKKDDYSKDSTISSILKSISNYEDVEITNIQVKDSKNINIEIRCNNIDNLKSKVNSIEKIPGFNNIDKVQIENLKNQEYVAVLYISFVK